MKRFSIVAIVVVCFASSSAFGADQLKYFHSLCASSGGGPLSSEIPCMKALINNSSDPIYNKTDAATQLFVLSSDQLLHRLEDKHITEDAARIKYLQMQIALEDKHHADVDAVETRKQAQADRQQALSTAEAETERSAAREAQRQAFESARDAQLAQQREVDREEMAEQQRQSLAAQVQAQQIASTHQEQRNAVQFCVAQVMQRTGWMSANAAHDRCEGNPSYFQMLPSATVRTNCQRIGSDNLACTSQ